MADCNLYIEPDIEQTPNESVAYTVNWPKRNLPDNTTIVSQEYFPAGTTDYTLSNFAIVDDGLQTQFTLTGGIAGTIYGITNRITLSDGEVMEDTLLYNCVLQNTRKRECVI